jgi:hypothetical protein
MTILTQLDDLRSAFPRCVAVGLVDVSSGIVLCVSTTTKRPQEQLDALCAVAAQLFNSPAAEGFSKALDSDDTTALHQGVVIADTDTCLFVRSPVDPMEAMFCLCEPEIDVDGALKAARTTLNKIATE